VRPRHGGPSPGLVEFLGEPPGVLDAAPLRERPPLNVCELDKRHPAVGLMIPQQFADRVQVDPSATADRSVVSYAGNSYSVQDEQVRWRKPR